MRQRWHVSFWARHLLCLSLFWRDQTPTVKRSVEWVKTESDTEKRKETTAKEAFWLAMGSSIHDSGLIEPKLSVISSDVWYKWIWRESNTRQDVAVVSCKYSPFSTPALCFPVPFITSITGCQNVLCPLSFVCPWNIISVFWAHNKRCNNCAPGVSRIRILPQTEKKQLFWTIWKQL